MSRTTRLRLIAAPASLLLWEAASWSGLFYRGVLPSVRADRRVARGTARPASFWWHLGTTAMEVALALLIGGGARDRRGRRWSGGGRLLRRGYEPALHYLAPTPKIVFLPILIVLFGVRPGFEVAMGALSCFFPVALSVASGMALDQPGPPARRAQLPAVALATAAVGLLALAGGARWSPGLRLGLGVAVIGCLLSEIKLSNRGLGFLAIQYYSQFRIPEMYAVLIVVFALAGAGNLLFGRVRIRGATA